MAASTEDQIMKLLFAAAIFVATIFMPALAFAADGAVVVPYGDLLTELAHVVSPMILPLALLVIAKVPGPAGLFLRTFLGERLVRNAVDYAVNAVEGAAKGKTLSVPVGSAVFAQAVQYALDEGAPWLVKTLGGPDGIKLKIFRALDLEPDATVEKIATAA
jgi:hypothetical protein